MLNNLHKCEKCTIFAPAFRRKWLAKSERLENSRSKEIVFGNKGGRGSLLYDHGNNELASDSEIFRETRKIEK